MVDYLKLTAYGLIALGAAIAANIPRSVIHGQTPEDRRAEVFSDFIALSDTRGAEALPFLSDLAGLTGEARRMQLARLDRVAPEVLGLMGQAAGLSPEDFRQALVEGRLPDPFDHSGSVVETPDFDHHGTDGSWFWGVWAQHDGGLEETPEGTGPLRACRIWLVVWNDTQWFYAPMGTEALNAIALAAAPDLLGVPFARLPRCAAEAS